MINNAESLLEEAVVAKAPFSAKAASCSVHEIFWDWINNSLEFLSRAIMALGIILEHMQCSFQNVKQKKKDKENILQDKFNKAKQTFECDPTNKNASDFNTRVLKRGGGGYQSHFPDHFFSKSHFPVLKSHSH